MARKTHPDGICECCRKVGPTVADLDLDDPQPLCDRCNYAQHRWEAWQYQRSHPGAGYPYFEGPPKSPPLPGGLLRR